MTKEIQRNIVDLEQDVVNLIFNYLATEDLAKVARGCKKFNKFVEGYNTQYPGRMFAKKTEEKYGILLPENKDTKAYKQIIDEYMKGLEYLQNQQKNTAEEKFNAVYQKLTPYLNDNCDEIWARTIYIAINLYGLVGSASMRAVDKSLEIAINLFEKEPKKNQYAELLLVKLIDDYLKLDSNKRFEPIQAGQVLSKAVQTARSEQRLREDRYSDFIINHADAHLLVHSQEFTDLFAISSQNSAPTLHIA